MAGFFVFAQCLRHAVDGAVQAAFVARRLVFVDQPLVGDAINDGYGAFIGLAGFFLVAGFDGFEDLLDLRAHHAAASRVLLAPFFCLAGAFRGLR